MKIKLGSLVQSRGVVGGKASRVGIVVELVSGGDVLKICWHKSHRFTHVLAKDMIEVTA